MAGTERYPFWGYGDLLVFVGLAVVSFLISALAVSAVFSLLHPAIHSKAALPVTAQFIGYGILFALLFTLFQVQYGRPFWYSLRWVSSPVSGSYIVLLGILLAIAVSVAGALLQTPDINSPMKELLSDRTSVLLLAIFGTTLGPLCEELIFRGFMQPLFVRTLGPVPGILLAAVPFGLLHLQQYAFSWRHGLMITLAGAAFGWMRHADGFDPRLHADARGL